LHRLAGYYMGLERSGHTLQPTALLHETYLRLIDQRRVDWKNRAQFFGLAASIEVFLFDRRAKDAWKGINDVPTRVHPRERTTTVAGSSKRVLTRLNAGF